MTTKPTVVFVPGAGHTPESFQEVGDILKSAGYGYIGVDTPSVSLKPPYVQSFDPDVEAVRAAITEAADGDGGQDVVLVMHSYGGQPGSAAAKGLSKEDRTKEGKKGGIIRLIYIAAFALDEGISTLQMMGGELGPGFDVNENRAIPLPPGPDEDSPYYSDLPRDVQQKWTSKLQHQAIKSLYSPQTYAAWKHIPSTYLITEQDKAMPPPVQEVFSSQEGGLWTVERIQSSHSPFLSRPKETADVVRRAAGEDV